MKLIKILKKIYTKEIIKITNKNILPMTIYMLMIFWGIRKLGFVEMSWLSMIISSIIISICTLYTIALLTYLTLKKKGTLYG